jgi:hypothetical protein
MHGHVAHGYLNYMIASSYNLAGMFEWGAKCSRKGQNISCETFFMSNLILGEMLHRPLICLWAALARKPRYVDY